VQSLTAALALGSEWNQQLEGMPLDRISVLGSDGALVVEVPVVDLRGHMGGGDGEAEPDRQYGRAKCPHYRSS
jgi:hypothetical protein